MTKQEEIEKISDLVKNCRKCKLWKTRNKPVVGAGSITVRVMFIGEAPGRNEDLQGLPFVGKAGKILDELLTSVGFQRDDVYIANILKCRPPENRNPFKSEIETCTFYLDKQIEIIQPIVICPLGNFATSFIFNKFGLGEEKISKVHGKVFNAEFNNQKVKIIPMYHPAVATYSPNTLDVLKEDFKKIEEV